MAIREDEGRMTVDRRATGETGPATLFEAPPVAEPKATPRRTKGIQRAIKGGPTTALNPLQASSVKARGPVRRNARTHPSQQIAGMEILQSQRMAEEGGGRTGGRGREAETGSRAARGPGQRCVGGETWLGVATDWMGE